MNVQPFIVALVWGVTLEVSAQPDPGALSAGDEAEEVIVVGRRAIRELRIQLWDAERMAYEIFNAFNDEPRFDIRCGMHAPTGGRIQRQVCAPNFELEAARQHAKDYYWSLYALLDNDTDDESAVRQSAPVEMMVASQQAAYRRKMRQVAEEHPEFLDALVRYSEIRQRYEAATRTGDSGEAE